MLSLSEFLTDLAKAKATHLDLSNRLLWSLPPEIGGLTDLVELNLRHSRLISLPLQIALLTNLRTLKLSDNDLKTVPSQIQGLSSLTALDLSHNRLARLPTEFCKLPKLAILYLNNNSLRSLPQCFAELNQLRWLSLSNNDLEDLPKQIGLVNLTGLVLSRNRLTEIPPDIGQQANLRQLYIAHNNLTRLPSEIGELRNLSHLDLTGNELSSLSPEIGKLTGLKELLLSDNRLTELPREIGQLQNLEVLIIRDNALKELPEEIGWLRKLRKLDLSGNVIRELPDLGRLTDLAELNLNDNHLTELPKEIGDLSDLKSLNLERNKLTSLPVEFKHLDNLSHLDLSRNSFSSLPKELASLNRLKTLHFSHNELTSLSPEIGELSSLIWLSLHGNSLRRLPREIGQLSGLQRLIISQNKLQQLPRQIGQLTRLTEIVLDNNRLTRLPVEIAELINLTNLDAGNNFLQELPPELGRLNNLQFLNISNNRLRDLPTELSQLYQLRELVLAGNGIQMPPELLSKPGQPASILKFYVANRSGAKRSLNEAKMLVVGQGSVGKTSLIKRLAKGTFNPNENKTEGIEIQKWRVSTHRSPLVTLNIWDFGGQEIMHATHQFFLTKRSIYLLVLDARLNDQENRVEYWLKIIQSFGKNSPVIVVCNKLDQQPIDLDRRGLQKKYATIKAFVETSCSTGAGIEQLREVIAEQVAALEHIHDQLPLAWFKVKTRLENMRDDFIQYQDYERLCRYEEINDELNQSTLLGFMHDLGVVLNFRDDPRLQDTNILNPEWVTNGVYRILNSHSLFQSKGVLEREALNHILDPSKYPKDKHHLIIMDMMRKFELCFDFEGLRDQKFLIPDLLTREEPDTGDWSEALQFEYHYNVLPSSIISRFIVRMHPYINKNTLWRTGAVLLNDGDRALVKADMEDRKISILIGGSYQSRRRLLEVIRSNFNSIHRTIPGLIAEEKVPLPNYPGVVVDFKHLVRLEVNGIREWIPEGLEQPLRVSELLDGLESKQSRRERHENNFEQDKRHLMSKSPMVDAPIDDHAFQALSRIKMKLDANSEQFARRCLLIYFGGLVASGIAVAGLVYKFGWDTMEPWTYFIGGVAVIGTYGYFAITLKELSPLTIYHQLVEMKKTRSYRLSGFNLENYEKLMANHESQARLRYPSNRDFE